MPSFSIETNPLCSIVCGGVPMSVMGGVFDTQLMHAAWLCLCSQMAMAVALMVAAMAVALMVAVQMSISGSVGQ